MKTSALKLRTRENWLNGCYLEISSYVTLRTGTRSTQMFYVVASNLLFEYPEQYQIATGGRLIDDHVTDKIRIIRRSVDDPVQNMSFHYGNFNISNVALDKVPPISIYSNKNKTGFAPGNRKKLWTILPHRFACIVITLGPFLSHRYW